MMQKWVELIALLIVISIIILPNISTNLRAVSVNNILEIQNAILNKTLGGHENLTLKGNNLNGLLKNEVAVSNGFSNLTTKIHGVTNVTFHFLSYGTTSQINGTLLIISNGSTFEALVYNGYANVEYVPSGYAKLYFYYPNYILYPADSGYATATKVYKETFLIYLKAERHNNITLYVVSSENYTDFETHLLLYIIAASLLSLASVETNRRRKPW